MKPITFLFITFIFTISANCQNHIALRTGIFFSKQDYSSLLITDEVKGLELGLSTRIFLYESGFVQPEISFIQKGGLWKNPMDDFEIKINQLEIAALLGYELKLKNLSIFPNLGIFIGKNINEGTRGNPFNNFDYVAFIDEDIEWGFIYGGGIGIQLGKGKLFAEYRYRFSKKHFRLIDRGSSPTNTLPNIKITNKGWGFNFGYALLL